MNVKGKINAHPRHISILGFAGGIAAFAVGTLWGFHLNTLALPQMTVPTTETMAMLISTTPAAIGEDYILGPDEYGDEAPACGAPKKPYDCPQWYSLKAVIDHAAISDAATLTKHRAALDAARTKAQADCAAQANGIQQHGGYCLTPHDTQKRMIEHASGVSYPLSNDHALASKRLTQGLVNLVTNEKVSSIIDFGAGVGQYKATVLTGLKGTPEGDALDYYACDAAGNGNEYTLGQMEFCDLTIPLDLKPASWVISFEVGEHVPSKYEGMVIRNIHRHNKKGVILSWAIPGQNGRRHINNHSNDHLIRVFTALGYTYDKEMADWMRENKDKDNYPWFEKSIMVFRRNNPLA